MATNPESPEEGKASTRERILRDGAQPGARGEPLGKTPEAAPRSSARGLSSTHLDRLNETELQSSIFRIHEDQSGTIDFRRLEQILSQESQIPAGVANKALSHIRAHLDALGLAQPAPTLVVYWLTALLREMGYGLGDISLQSLELSLGDVELSIYHPLGSGTGADRNPEATSRRIAQRIKNQFAGRRIFQEDVIAAHDGGALELLHLGAIDRPHDIYLTPDYIKIAGLPVAGSAPAAGPAKRAEVLLSHLIRFTHELQNHFAGDIQWGYVNTLMLPYLSDMSESDLHQFVQQMLFEFAQLDVERGGLDRKVIIDLDFDLPRQFTGLPVLGPGGTSGRKTYGSYRKTLTLFNEICLDILKTGDYRGNPFHSPLIVYHLNNPKTTWSGSHQKLLALAYSLGNPSIAFSFYRRNLGPLGLVYLNDPDFLKLIQEPWQLRGFSSHSVAINLARLGFGDKREFSARMAAVMDLTVAAHRQKRLFLSRLMAYGHRGPLHFLRHKIKDQPFLKIDQASQPLHIIGLGEAAALQNGSHLTQPEVLGRMSLQILQDLNGAVRERNHTHKLTMFLSHTKNESVAYRFAFLDLRAYGRDHSAFLFHKPDQSHPIYTEGANILAFTNLPWRDRLRIEGGLHKAFGGFHHLTMYVRHGSTVDASFFQMLYQEALRHGIGQLQMAPDMVICMNCFYIFGEAGQEENCPSCASSLVAPYGYCQGHFSPVHTWCLGKRSEWKIRHRSDEYKRPIQPQLPM